MIVHEQRAGLVQRGAAGLVQRGAAGLVQRGAIPGTVVAVKLAGTLQRGVG